MYTWWSHTTSSDPWMEKVNEPPIDGTLAPPGTVDAPQLHSSLLCQQIDKPSQTGTRDQPEASVHSA